ncbi:hypothetical protein HDU96_003985, partial [Phlyctochytrium bullatum]
MQDPASMTQQAMQALASLPPQAMHSPVPQTQQAMHAPVPQTQQTMAPQVMSASRTVRHVSRSQKRKTPLGDEKNDNGAVKAKMPKPKPSIASNVVLGPPRKKSAAEPAPVVDPSKSMNDLALKAHPEKAKPMAGKENASPGVQSTRSKALEVGTAELLLAISQGSDEIRVMGSDPGEEDNEEPGEGGNGNADQEANDSDDDDDAESVHQSEPDDEAVDGGEEDEEGSVDLTVGAVNNTPYESEDEEEPPVFSERQTVKVFFVVEKSPSSNDTVPSGSVPTECKITDVPYTSETEDADLTFIVSQLVASKTHKKLFNANHEYTVVQVKKSFLQVASVVDHGLMSKMLTKNRPRAIETVIEHDSRIKTT